VFVDIKGRVNGLFDPVRFEQVLANYISNASRYGDSQKKIIIRARAHKESIRITVFNTGRHIDPAKLSSLWSGFFKLDDARTRVPDSYGLGLSVVKAIQDAAGMGCGARNVKGGVEFWFDVKRRADAE